MNSCVSFRCFGLLLGRDELEAITPRVFGVETAGAGDRVIVDDGDAAGYERLAQFIEVGDGEGGVSFLGWREIVLDADVDLTMAALKPAAAARARVAAFRFLSCREASRRILARRARILRARRFECDRCG